MSEWQFATLQEVHDKLLLAIFLLQIMYHCPTWFSTSSLMTVYHQSYVNMEIINVHYDSHARIPLVNFHQLDTYQWGAISWSLHNGIPPDFYIAI